jgi:hypothetical protein
MSIEQELLTSQAPERTAIEPVEAPPEDPDGDAASKIAEWMGQLVVPHRAKAAYRALLDMGFIVAPAARDGLRHENPDVRYYCCALLDHFLLPEAQGDLIGVLRDPDPHVRQMALHALACDRCKEGDCRPTEADVLPEALRVLDEDSDPHVRAMALEVIGQYVHTSLLAERALIAANKNDASPAVRKKAGWYAPGGPIHRRTAPRPARRAQR